MPRNRATERSGGRTPTARAMCAAHICDPTVSQERPTRSNLVFTKVSCDERRSPQSQVRHDSKATKSKHPTAETAMPLQRRGVRFCGILRMGTATSPCTRNALSR